MPSAGTASHREINEGGPHHPRSHSEVLFLSCVWAGAPHPGQLLVAGKAAAAHLSELAWFVATPPAFGIVFGTQHKALPSCHVGKPTQ